MEPSDILWAKKILTKMASESQSLPITEGGKELIEPPHDKTNSVAVRPAKTHISLGIRPSD